MVTWEIMNLKNVRNFITNKIIKLPQASVEWLKTTILEIVDFLYVAGLLMMSHRVNQGVIISGVSLGLLHRSLALKWIIE